MSGLNVITDAIIQKAKADATDILAQAEEKKQELLETAKQEAKAKTDEIFKESEERIKNIELASKSAAQQKLSRDLLEKKAQLIKETAIEAKAKIFSVSDEEYNKILLRLLEKYANKSKPGEILFSANDKNRLLGEVKTKIKNLNLEICNTSVDILGGFILRYGKVEENCSIEAIFHDRQEQITDFLNSKLFG